MIKQLFSEDCEDDVCVGLSYRYEGGVEFSLGVAKRGSGREVVERMRECAE